MCAHHLFIDIEGRKQEKNFLIPILQINIQSIPLAWDTA